MANESDSVQDFPPEVLGYFFLGSVGIALCLAIFVAYLRWKQRRREAQKTTQQNVRRRKRGGGRRR